MKVFDVKETQVRSGIVVDMDPYPHVTLGQGGHKDATWVGIQTRSRQVVVNAEIPIGGVMTRSHVVFEVGVEPAMGKNGEPTERHVITLPPDESDERALVLWHVSSGYRGTAEIQASEGVLTVGYDKAWHSGKGNMGETAEFLAVLEPGQVLTAEVEGRNVQTPCGYLYWDGAKIITQFGDESLWDIIPR